MLKSKIIFLSHFINVNTPVYGGDTDAINVEKIRSISKGDTSNNLKLSFPGHVNTHIDFPYHFDDNGKKSNDYDPINWIFNKVGFVESYVEDIENEIANLPSDIECLILKTGFEQYRGLEKYWKEQPIINASLATTLKSKFPNLRLFGFDMISLTSKLDRSEGKKAHLAFLIDNDILILEDMHLAFLEHTPKQIIVAPLQIDNADGVPCTVLAYI
jgi:kynurenine formamidase